MKKELNALGACLVVGLIALAGVGVMAATHGDSPAKASNGAVQVSSYDAGTLSADGGTQPTKVFTGLPGRNAFSINNGGPVTIYCGWSSNVTPSTGFPVPANATLSVDLVWSSGGTDFYCIGTAGNRDQDAPLDTRWIQVK